MPDSNISDGISDLSQQVEPVPSDNAGPALTCFLDAQRPSRVSFCVFVWVCLRPVDATPSLAPPVFFLRREPCVACSCNAMRSSPLFRRKWEPPRRHSAINFESARPFPAQACSPLPKEQTPFHNVFSGFRSPPPGI